MFKVKRKMLVKWNFFFLFYACGKCMERIEGKEMHVINVKK